MKLIMIMMVTGYADAILASLFRDQQSCVAKATMGRELMAPRTDRGARSAPHGRASRVDTALLSLK